jgi:hypothetical protein
MQSNIPDDATARTEQPKTLKTIVPTTLAVILGLLVAVFDVAVPFGDDTEKCTVLLWAVFSGLLGYVQPRRVWRWAFLVGPWVPATHFVLHVLDLPDTVNPDSYITILILVPVSLVICGIGAWTGAILRHVV